MDERVSRGKTYGHHVYIDYVNFYPNVDDCSSWILHVLRSCVKECGVKEVHSHSEKFEGKGSPPGFASIVLIDESHVTAHCYSDKGWLALDAFTCGKHDPNVLANSIHKKLIEKCDNLILMKRESVDRFVHNEF